MASLTAVLLLPALLVGAGRLLCRHAGVRVAAGRKCVILCMCDCRRRSAGIRAPVSLSE